MAQDIHESMVITPDNASPIDQFGISVAMSEDWIVVGTRIDNGAIPSSAYIFDRATGNQLFELTVPNGAPTDFFSEQIAIENNVIAVGAARYDQQGADAGCVFIFDATTGQETMRLFADDIQSGDNFGYDMAIDGDIIVVGASFARNNVGLQTGVAYVFDLNTGLQLAKLQPNEQEIFDFFGGSVDINDGIVAVSSRQSNNAGTNSGSVFLFDQTTGTQLFRLLPADGAAFDFFGQSIALADNVVAVSAHLHDTPAGANTGAVYLFDTTTGLQISKITPNDAAPNDNLGFEIDIDSNLLAISAHRHGASGAVYTYDLLSHSLQAKLVPSNLAQSADLGWSVSVHQGQVAAGAPRAIGGSALIFNTTCQADINNDGLLNFFDISAFLIAFNANNPIADFNADGTWNFFDISAFLSIFEAGCP